MTANIITMTRPDNAPLHPGEAFREDILPHLRLSSGAFARHIGIKLDELNAFIDERRRVTPDLARRLGEALGTGARYWLTLQLQYDLWEADEAGGGPISPVGWRRRTTQAEQRSAA